MRQKSVSLPPKAGELASLLKPKAGLRIEMQKYLKIFTFIYFPHVHRQTNKRKKKLKQWRGSGSIKDAMRLMNIKPPQS